MIVASGVLKQFLNRQRQLIVWGENASPPAWVTSYAGETDKLDDLVRLEPQNRSGASASNYELRRRRPEQHILSHSHLWRRLSVVVDMPRCWEFSICSVLVEGLVSAAVSACTNGSPGFHCFYSRAARVRLQGTWSAGPALYRAL